MTTETPEVEETGPAPFHPDDATVEDALALDVSNMTGAKVEHYDRIATTPRGVIMARLIQVRLDTARTEDRLKHMRADVVETEANVRMLEHARAEYMDAIDLLDRE